MIGLAYRPFGGYWEIEMKWGTPLFNHSWLKSRVRWYSVLLDWVLSATEVFAYSGLKTFKIVQIFRWSLWQINPIICLFGELKIVWHHRNTYSAVYNYRKDEATLRLLRIYIFFWASVRCSCIKMCCICSLYVF